MNISKNGRDREGGDILPLPPTRGTSALHAYTRASMSDLRFFSFICDTVVSSDYVAHIAKQALDGVKSKAKQPTELAQSAPGNRTIFLRKNSQALLEMFIARQVDNFQKYLVDLIRQVLRSKPAMLSTKQQSISLEDVLKHGSIESLVHDVIERRVNTLSYDGFADLQKWSEERGIQIKVAASRRDAVVELISTRNVIAHNRGFVDERYLRAVKNAKFKVGECRKIEVEELFNALKLLNGVVFATDSAARIKFKLATVEIRPRKKPGRKKKKEAEDSQQQLPLG
ncbi:hypothetical protein IVA98_24810 [Bradyrhizobium sp. 160]|uniref:hypothetical protein n=1 Tax=Bradyrhizobium sp. 160 TaxID=2782634 RepID=UPI001FF8927D|nr:hypothetical protein [Bradyrhizobium sp. 160]MCK1626319.1 hypothetical protein [Bradyrhizobium sp. 160]